MEPNRLFVYGTLRRGNDNPHATWLHAHSRFVGEGSITGTLHRVGEYTGLVPGDGPEVHGEVFELNNTEETWQLLDPYEGENYQRQIVTVTLNDAGKLDTTVYAYKRPG